MFFSLTIQLRIEKLTTGLIIDIVGLHFLYVTNKRMQTKETSSFAYDVLDIKESRNWLKNKQFVKLSVTKSKTRLANFWNFKKAWISFLCDLGEGKNCLLTITNTRRKQNELESRTQMEVIWPIVNTHSFYSKLRMDLPRNWLKLSAVITVWAKWNAMYEKQVAVITISSSYVINKTFPWGNKKKIFFHYFKAAWTPLVSSQLHQFEKNGVFLLCSSQRNFN